MRRLFVLMLAVVGSGLSQVASADVWLDEIVHSAPGFAVTTEPCLVADEQDALHLILHDFDAQLENLDTATRSGWVKYNRETATRIAERLEEPALDFEDQIEMELL